MEENIEFERCIEFLVRMIEKYGDVIFSGMDRNRTNNEMRIIKND